MTDDTDDDMDLATFAELVARASYSYPEADDDKVKVAEYFGALAIRDSNELWDGAAVNFLLPAAKRGHAKAALELALIYMYYENGDGLADGFEYFKIAAAGGNADAQFHLARCYLTGAGVAKNYNEAARLFAEAWQGGSTERIEDYDDDLTAEEQALARWKQRSE